MLNNTLVNIGESYLVIIFDKEYNDDYQITKPSPTSENSDDQKLSGREKYSNLTIKIFSENSHREVKNFSSSTDNLITIGRSPDCTISIEDSLLSRVHMSIEFDKKNQHWILYDGYKKSGTNLIAKSTNGTWIYPSEDVLISDGVMFKTSNTLFRCKVLY